MTTQFAPTGRRLIGGTGRILVAEALALPSGLAVTVFLTRRLGPADFGLFTVTAALIVVIESMINAAFARSTVKFIGEADNWAAVADTVIWLNLVVSAAVVLGLWLLAGPLAMLLKDGRLASYIRLFALDVPVFCLADAHQRILVGLGRFGQRAVASASRWLVRVLLIVGLVAIGFSVAGAIVGSIGASLIEFAVGRYFIRPALFRRGAFPAARLWNYATPLLIFSVSVLLFNKLDLFVLKTLGASAGDAGIYGAAQNIARVPGVFALSFTPVLLATLSRALHLGDLAQARRLTRYASRLMIGLLPFAALAAGSGTEIVRLAFGAKYAPGGPVLSLLMFGTLAMATISVLTAVVIAAGRPSWTLIPAAPMIPLALAGHLLLIPRLGSVGAATVSMLVAVLGALLTLGTIYRLWGLVPPVGTVVRSLLLGALIYGLAAAWHTPGWHLFLKLGLLSLAVPLGFLLTGEFDAGEIAVARSYLRGTALARLGV